MSVLELIGRHLNSTGFWLINWLRNTDTAVVHNTYRELVTLVGDGTLSARSPAPCGSRTGRTR